jgi:hypothetical protein
MGIREKLQALPKRRYLTVEVEGLGECCFQNMNERERGRLDYLEVVALRGKSEDELEEARAEQYSLSNARAIQMTLVNPETKQREYSDHPDDTEEIIEMDSRIIAMMVHYINRHCGFAMPTQDEEKAIVKNSETTPGDTSPTLSLKNAAG